MTGLIRTLAAVGLVMLAGCVSNQSAKTTTTETSGSASAVPPAAAPATTYPGAPIDGLKEVTTSTGLRYYDLKIGDGALAEQGKTAAVAYSGWLTDGTPFDSSVDNGRPPYPVRLGAGGVIQGWQEGLLGMRVGGKRKLIIPPSLGYGAEGYGGGVIPPNATLVFDVEVTDLR